ncbi:MAG: ABC transporter substrate-binding protein [Calothrix sp. SM1_5_4]|nr:ABC transporter substrate-binding protein [Calothrix sp. SM1_5_4]
MRDWFKKQNRLKSRTSPPDDLLPPVVDFDAIFIPDGPKAVGQIARMLPYQGVPNIRLLGTNVWNSSDLIRRGEKTVEKAIFIDTNLVNDDSFKNSRFFKEFQKVFGEEPGLFEAQGYEVGVLLRRLISDGERSRAGLAAALAELRQFQGVSGPMTMNSQKELLRPLTAFSISQGEIVAWTPALEAEKPTSAPPGGAKKSTRKQ